MTPIIRVPNHVLSFLNDCYRECKDEIEDKKQELIDMDQALKERNWELKQRAAQVRSLPD